MGIEELSFDELGKDKLTVEAVSETSHPVIDSKITNDNTTHIALLIIFIRTCPF